MSDLTQAQVGTQVNPKTMYRKSININPVSNTFVSEHTASTELSNHPSPNGHVYFPIVFWGKFAFIAIIQILLKQHRKEVEKEKTEETDTKLECFLHSCR